MDAANRIVEALLVEHGRIKAVGSTAEITAIMRSNTRVIDLAGRSLLPGFVDAHSHFPASGISTVSVDLSSPPVGDITSSKQLLARLQDASGGGDEEDWLLGYNYDNTGLIDGDHPTRMQLDGVVSNRPVYLWHSSGHMGVANSKALEKLGIDDKTRAPAGGTFGLDKDTGKLNGLLQEKAAPPLARIVGQYSYAKQLGILTSARDEYLAAGITTVQNGYAGINQMRMLQAAQWLGLLPQRVVVWPAHDKHAVNYQPLGLGRTPTRFVKGAVKIIVDGSPQGMTAYLSEPYFNTRAKPENYRGTPLISQPALNELVLLYHKAGFQLALHGNGDAAIEQIITAVELAQSQHPRVEARHILVHAQTIRQDQIDRLSKAGLSPSFFNSHTFYWGDWHRIQALGPVRAANISPAKWAQEAGVRFSLHSDSPVTPINPMQLLWSATNRKTSSGHVLGSAQRIDKQAALRAMTIDAAWQHHLDGFIGSLEKGKLADMVVLSNNPLDAEDARQIQVLATYVEGKEHYSSNP